MEQLTSVAIVLILVLWGLAKTLGRPSNSLLSCPLECAGTMNTDMAEINLPKSGLLHTQLLDEISLDKFCGIYRAGKKCLDDCGESSMKFAVATALQAPHYVCVVHYKNYLSYLPCFNETQDKLKGCELSCGGLDKIDKLKGNLTLAVTHKNFNKLHDIMNETCQTLACEINCEEPIIIHRCPFNEAAYFMRNLIKASLKPMEMALEKVGAEHRWPQTCAELSKDETPAIVQSSNHVSTETDLSSTIHFNRETLSSSTSNNLIVAVNATTGRRSKTSSSMTTKSVPPITSYTSTTEPSTATLMSTTNSAAANPFKTPDSNSNSPKTVVHHVVEKQIQIITTSTTPKKWSHPIKNKTEAEASQEQEQPFSTFEHVYELITPLPSPSYKEPRSPAVNQQQTRSSNNSSTASTPVVNGADSLPACTFTATPGGLQKTLIIIGSFSAALCHFLYPQMP